MRNQWKLLFLRSINRSSFQNTIIDPLHLQVRNLDRNFCNFSSFLSKNVHRNTFDFDISNPRIRCFSSETALEQKELDQVVLFTDILSKSSCNDEIKVELESNNLSISHEMGLNVLQNLEGNPEVAWKFFNFVSETENERLSSKSYNLMLAILGRKDYVKQFWFLFDVMKKKGYGVSKRTYMKVSKSFEKEEMGNDFEKFKELYTLKPDENSIERLCSRVCKVIREKEWDEDVQTRLKDLNISWSSDLVAMIIEHFSVHPTKALMFFWWVEENPSYKHNKLAYNAMLKVLGREDCIEKFWRIVDEMKEAGCEMEMETYVKVMGRFYKRRMIKDAVDLYEFMMCGATKLPDHDSVFLLRKIVVSKDLDMDHFSRVVKIFTEGGTSLSKSTFDGVVKSLSSVGKLQECGKILKAMEEGGFTPTNAIYNKLIFQLGNVGRLDEAIQIIDEMEASGQNPDFKMWSSLIHGQCMGGDVEKAASSFRRMVEKNGVTDTGYALELVVHGFCRTRRAEDAHKFLSEMVNGTQLRPWHTTYKMLIKRLLVRGNFKEALTLLGLMKDHGYPPFLDPFINCISKSGTGDDAMSFLSAMTEKKFPSTSVFIRLFEAFFKAGRHNEAHNCFSKCPSYIRSHADVLNLFCAQRSEDADVTAVAA